jgi:hypothetical protein
MSNSSIRANNFSFSFLYLPLRFFSHPLRNWWKCNFILPSLYGCITIWYIGPFCCHHAVETFFFNQDSSKEKHVCFPKWAQLSEAISNGVWSNPEWVRACTVTKGTVAPIQNLLKFDCTFHRRSPPDELSMWTAYLRELFLVGQGFLWSHYFHWRIMSKAPPTNIGRGSCSHMWTNSDRRFVRVLGSTITGTNTLSKPSFWHRIWILTRKSPVSTFLTCRVAELVPTKISP